MRRGRDARVHAVMHVVVLCWRGFAPQAGVTLKDDVAIIVTDQRRWVARRKD